MKHSIHRQEIRRGKDRWRFELDPYREGQLLLTYERFGGDYREPVEVVSIPFPLGLLPTFISHFTKGQHQLRVLTKTAYGLPSFSQTPLGTGAEEGQP